MSVPLMISIFFFFWIIYGDIICNAMFDFY